MRPEPEGDRGPVTRKATAGVTCTIPGAQWIERVTVHEGNARFWVKDAATGKVLQVNFNLRGLQEARLFLDDVLAQLLGEVTREA